MHVVAQVGCVCCHSPFDELDVVVACVQARRSVLYSAPEGNLFRQLLDLLSFYCDFPLNDHTGEQLKDDDVVGQHYDKVGVWTRYQVTCAQSAVQHLQMAKESVPANFTY